ncbi:MAG TPA: AmmeMemoRadiSam system protein B, partial [Chloroflexi bacterium]|nr:AmmeMemoRadiSam system protein B [Chloroflexota bacterium]
MSARMPYVAGMFYPAEEDSCRREIEVYLQAVDPAGLVGPVFGGLAPHAGWTYSGATMAQLYATLADEDAPDTVVLLGAAHQWGMGGAILYGSGAWRTPL